MDDNEIKAMEAQKVHWEKQMLEGTLSASEVNTYMKLRMEVEILKLKAVSKAAPRPTLPAYDDDEDDIIPFARSL